MGNGKNASRKAGADANLSQGSVNSNFGDTDMHDQEGASAVVVSSPDKKRTKRASQGDDASDYASPINSDAGDGQGDADEKLKEEFAKTLDPALIKYSDFIMKRFDSRFETMFERMNAKYDKVLERAQAAEDRAAAAETAAHSAKATAKVAHLTASELQATVSDQGKRIAELEEQYRELAEKTRWTKCGGKICLGASSNDPSLASSPEDRLLKMQKAYMDLVADSEATNRLILGRKKGMNAVSVDVAKALFESFFPGVSYFVVKPPNVEFFCITVMDSASVKKVHQGSKASWMELGSMGWWLSADKPDAMRKFEARAREFVAYVKEQGEDAKKAVCYVTTENGVLSKNGIEILPLFLVPGKLGQR